MTAEATPATPAPGTFFDHFPKFFETSATGPYRDRLNLRYEAIFAENRDVFQGARVLDIASHDGRWSMAALQTGAAEVVGIEGRAGLVRNSNKTFKHYGIDRSRYRFVAGDIFEVVAAEEMHFDVVMCLGFLYHTARYNELMYHIRRMQPHHLILDTDVIKHKEPFVKVRSERIARQGNAVADRYSFGDRVFSGVPSVAAVGELLDAYGFDVEKQTDWKALLAAHPDAEPRSIGSYRAGKRVTIRAKSRDDFPDTTLAAPRSIPAPNRPATSDGTSITQRAKRLARDLLPPVLTRWIDARRNG